VWKGQVARDLGFFCFLEGLKLVDQKPLLNFWDLKKTIFLSLISRHLISFPWKIFTSPKAYPRITFSLQSKIGTLFKFDWRFLTSNHLEEGVRWFRSLQPEKGNSMYLPSGVRRLTGVLKYLLLHGRAGNDPWSNIANFQRTTFLRQEIEFIWYDQLGFGHIPITKVILHFWDGRPFC